MPKTGAPWPRLNYCDLLKQHAGVAYDDVPGLDRKIRELKEDPTGMSLVDPLFRSACATEPSPQPRAHAFA